MKKPTEQEIQDYIVEVHEAQKLICNLFQGKIKRGVGMNAMLCILMLDKDDYEEFLPGIADTMEELYVVIMQYTLTKYEDEE